MAVNAEARFLDTLCRGVTDDDALKQALELVRAMFDCRGAVLLSLDTQAPATNVTLTSGIFNEYGRLYVEQFAAIDPAPAVFARLPVGTASSSDRILTREQLHSDAFVNEFFRPIGLAETLGGTLLLDQARFSLIGLQRGDDRDPFGDDDIATLERLMPHIGRAIQLRRAFNRAEAKSLGLQAALDRLAAGLVLLDAAGTASFVNAAMRAIDRRGDGLSLDRGGRPRPANLAARRRLDTLLDDVAKGGAGGVATVPRAGGAASYVVLVAPSPTAAGGTAAWETRAETGAVVLVHDPQSRTRSPPELLEQAMDLPRGAARLVAALAADDNLKSFAEREGVTIHTARFHLRTALARTGARTQADLVRLAVRLLRDLALARPDLRG